MKASLAEKFSLIHEHWRPKVVAELNGQELKIVLLGHFGLALQNYHSRVAKRLDSKEKEDDSTHAT